MFKAAFPWATKKEEQAELAYLRKTYSEAQETAGNYWVCFDFPLRINYSPKANSSHRYMQTQVSAMNAPRPATFSSTNHLAQFALLPISGPPLPGFLILRATLHPFQPFPLLISHQYDRSIKSLINTCSSCARRHLQHYSLDTRLARP